MSSIILSLFFFFNDTATTEIYTLSLHDALPIFDLVLNAFVERHLDDLDPTELEVFQAVLAYPDPMLLAVVMGQAEPEDANERGDRKSTRLKLQSRQYLVCRLLLEKKKKTK